MTGDEWYESLKLAIGVFEETHEAVPAVQITLRDGERFSLRSRRLGNRHPHFVTLEVYPPDPATGMIELSTGKRVCPRMMIVRPGDIAKIELLHDAPGLTRFTGFARSEA